MPRTILLPLDGSDAADAAMQSTLEYAERENATVHALYCVDTRRYGDPALSSSEVLVDDRDDDGHRRLAEFSARAAARGVDAETHRCRGDPDDELVRHAREVDADVVVLHGRVPHTVRKRLEEGGTTLIRPDETVTV